MNSLIALGVALHQKPIVEEALFVTGRATTSQLCLILPFPRIGGVLPRRTCDLCTSLRLVCSSFAVSRLATLPKPTYSNRGPLRHDL